MLMALCDLVLQTMNYRRKDRLCRSISQFGLAAHTHDIFWGEEAAKDVYRSRLCHFIIGHRYR